MRWDGISKGLCPWGYQSNGWWFFRGFSDHEPHLAPSSQRQKCFLVNWYFLTGNIGKKTCVIIILSSFHLETSVSKTRKWKCWSLFHQVGGRVATVIGSFHRYGSAIVRWVGFHSHGGTPSEHWMVYFMEDPSKMDDDWGYPYFRKLPFAGHVHHVQWRNWCRFSFYNKPDLFFICICARWKIARDRFCTSCGSSFPIDGGIRCPSYSPWKLRSDAGISAWDEIQKNPHQITNFLFGGINLPFPVMASKNGMVLTTLQCSPCESCDLIS